MDATLRNRIAALATEIPDMQEFTLDNPSGADWENAISYSAAHELWSKVYVVFPQFYFEGYEIPKSIRVAIELPPLRKPELVRRMESHGFKWDNTGGNCTAFSRTDGEIHEIVTLADDPSAPMNLADAVTVGMESLIESDSQEQITGYTFGDVLAALDNPSVEYRLLSLRLHNGFHKPIMRGPRVILIGDVERFDCNILARKGSLGTLRHFDPEQVTVEMDSGESIEWYSISEFTRDASFTIPDKAE